MFEGLESRVLRTVTLDQGELFILGSSSADTIAFDTGKTFINILMTKDGTPLPSQSFRITDVKHISIYAGSGNDTVILGRCPVGAMIKGEDGNDTLSGGAGPDEVLGTAGDDYCFGGDGKDTVDGGLGNDDMLGGAQRDTLDYSRRSNPLVITLGVLADDGELNEFDNARTDFEVVLGGTGADAISTTSGRSVEIYGGLGNDTLIGGSGQDVLRGGVGTDMLMGQGGADVFFTQDGQYDIVIGGSGDDTMGDVADLLDSITL